MRLFIIFIFLLSNSFAKEVPNIKNIVINEELKTYKNLAFLDSKQDIVELNNYEGKLVILNFWATWCAPCKKEMPSLDSLKSNKVLDNLEIFPINIGKDNLKKSQKFFSELNIKNLDIYFDNPITLTKELSLRGVPTTIIFNKKGKEFARIIGSIDFSDKNFIEWLSNYN
jgi:thiol-disulfide isomerase/thioredoxin|tara:strand:- start:45 stop:554 length:510 start_codon:yes stop_codon:yes gene_type:complete